MFDKKCKSSCIKDGELGQNLILQQIIDEFNI